MTLGWTRCGGEWLSSSSAFKQLGIAAAASGGAEPIDQASTFEWKLQQKVVEVEAAEVRMLEHIFTVVFGST